MKTETVIGRIFVSVYCDCFVCIVARGNGHKFLFTCGVCRRSGAVFYNVWALCNGSVCLMLKRPPVIFFFFGFINFWAGLGVTFCRATEQSASHTVRHHVNTRSIVEW